MCVCRKTKKWERERESVCVWYAGTAWSDVRDTPQKFDSTHSFRQKPRFDLRSSRRVVYSRNGKQRPRKSCNAYVLGRVCIPIIIFVRYCRNRILYKSKYVIDNPNVARKSNENILHLILLLYVTFSTCVWNMHISVQDINIMSHDIF